MKGIWIVENCLSYNISKSGKKLIIGKRDNLIWAKAKITSSMKNYTFWVQMPIWWRHNIRLAKIMHAFLSPTQWLSEYEIKFGDHRSSWGAITVLKKACFGANLHYIAHSSTLRIFNFDARSRPYKRSRVTEINGNCQLWYWESKSCEN